MEELTSLLDKSLLKRIGEERYDLHELVSQYAASYLQSDPREDFRTHGLHSNYYAVQLEQWGEKIASPRQMETLTEMDAEIDNVRLAWNWMVAHGRIANIQKSLHSLWRFHDIRGQFQDGLVLMRQAATMLQTRVKQQQHQLLNARLCSGECWHSRGTFVHILASMKKPANCCSKA